MINIKELIKDALTKFWSGCKKNVVNNLTSTSTDLPLSANMGKSLNDSKQAKITGAATTVTSNNLTASKVLVSNKDGKIVASSVGSSDIMTKSGVTHDSKTVNQLNAGSGSWLDNSTTSVVLTPGLYIIFGLVNFSGNANGKRAVAIYNATGNSTSSQSNTMATNTNGLSLTVTDIIYFTDKNRRYTLRYSQSSGSVLKVDCALRYVKLR